MYVKLCEMKEKLTALNGLFFSSPRMMTIMMGLLPLFSFLNGAAPRVKYCRLNCIPENSEES